MIISTKNLTKIYKGSNVKALDNLNLEVKEGEIFGFIGPNGAGKTTTIRLLLDLIRPTSGNISIFGLDVKKNSLEIKDNIGYLPGEIFLPENMTGRECINYYSNFKKEIDQKHQNNLIDRFKFDIEKKIGTYSKGNRQKLAIILALMHKPKLLILDEPTSGLDPLNQQTFYNCIAETKKWNSTTFLSTHILSEAEKICDRVGIIKNGKQVKTETIEEFKEKSIRQILIETKETISLDKLKMSKVKKIERTSFGYKLTISGNNGKIIKELAKYSFDDIKVVESSLEDIFMEYYQD